MGLNCFDFKFLVEAKVRLGRTLTIGRQNVHAGRSELRRLGLLPVEFDTYCEPILLSMGANSVDSMDASSYERATIVHDLNKPVPAQFHHGFETVIDGGSGEHVYNIPQVFQNYIDLLKRDGNLFLILPASNYCGHGFYQFSPDLMRRTFSAENGFEIKTLQLVAHTMFGPRLWSVPPDVMLTGRRNAIRSFNRLMLQLHAVKKADVPFQIPQQSDYLAVWNKGLSGKPRPAWRVTVIDHLPRLRYLLQWLQDFYECWK
jgi:hypothetical protein